MVNDASISFRSVVCFVSAIKHTKRRRAYKVLARNEFKLAYSVGYLQKQNLCKRVFQVIWRQPRCYSCAYKIKGTRRIIPSINLNFYTCDDDRFDKNLNNKNVLHIPIFREKGVGWLQRKTCRNKTNRNKELLRKVQL